VRLFVKLPAWFKVGTPVGQYNPAWALVMQQVDAHGHTGPLLYLVRATKSTTVAAELRGTENQKIHCGERHFVGALKVDYKVITSADELP
jgi:type III restriction enzyme